MSLSKVIALLITTALSPTKTAIIMTTQSSRREIIFYFDDFTAEQTHILNIMSSVARPGIFEVPASVAFPNYRDENHWQWTERGEFVVQVHER